VLEKDHPDSDAPNSFVWSLAGNKLYPLRPVTGTFKWPLTNDPGNTTSIATTVGRSKWPENPLIHIADSPVEHETAEPGFGLRFLNMPSGNHIEIREWRVVDQKIPVPFPIGFCSLSDPTWIPMNDSLSDAFAAVPRHRARPVRAWRTPPAREWAPSVHESRRQENPRCGD
jgi:hypothetical protein